MASAQPWRCQLHRRHVADIKELLSRFARTGSLRLSAFKDVWDHFGNAWPQVRASWLADDPRPEPVSFGAIHLVRAVYSHATKAATSVCLLTSLWDRHARKVWTLPSSVTCCMGQPWSCFTSAQASAHVWVQCIRSLECVCPSQMLSPRLSASGQWTCGQCSGCRRTPMFTCRRLGGMSPSLIWRWCCHSFASAACCVSP